MASSASGSGTGTRDPFSCPDSAPPQTSLRKNTDDVIAKINQQINMLKEGARKAGGHGDSSERREAQTVHVYRPDDFFTDEMSAIGSIDFVALSSLKDNRSGSRTVQHCFGHGSQHRAGQKLCPHGTDSSAMHGGAGQNGGYCVYPESGCRPPHHGVREFPDWHFRGGPRENRWGPCGRGSSLERGDAGPAGWGWGPPNPPSEVPAGNSWRNLKAKSRKQRRKALKAAAKAQAAQAAQALGTMVTAEHVADATPERQDVKPKREAKRKESPSAADTPECKIPKSTEDNETCTANRMERAATLAASNPGTAGQGSDTRSLTEDRSEEHSVPVGLPSVEHHTWKSSFTEADSSTEQQGGAARTPDGAPGGAARTPDGAPRKRRSLRKAGMKITAQRIAFVCSVCKFHSFYKKKMAVHLKSKFHKDHFRFLSEHLSEPTVDFLQTYFSNKHKKVEDFINQIPNHRAAVCQLYEDRDLTRDISMEHFMRKEEAAHCLACDVYIPMQHSSIQQHLKSPEHDHNCKVMVVQSKDSGLSVAQRILSHRLVCKKLKHYLEDSMVTDGAEEVRSAGQGAVPNAEADMMKQGAGPVGEQVIQGAGPVGEQVIQGAGPVGEQVIQGAGPVRDGEDQEAEPVCEGVVPAAEKIRNEDVQEEPEVHAQTESLFDLLSEEVDEEGVELGEEELGEDDYI